MVEFGLKLEDNKVSEWTDYYLDYDKLKALLKKAKSAKKKYDDQSAKRPADAAKILEAHRAGNKESVTITPSQSYNSLSALVGGSPPRDSRLEQVTEETLVSEKTSLLSDNRTPTSAGQGSLQYAPPLQPKESNVSKSFSHKALSDISDFFSSGYERTLRGYLKEIDDLDEKFAELIAEEQAKCVKFYYEKLNELEKQLSFLIDSVASSSAFRRQTGIDEEDIRRGAVTLGHHRRTSSEMTAQQRIDIFFNKLKTNPLMEKLRQKQMITTSVAAATKTKITKDEDSDDEGGDRDTEKFLAEADSIKRALIDQYRTAKLLQNYAILNYTGFVKIIKKHDKTIPEHKGRFKNILLPENLFQEGVAVEKVATQYETCYANWFCDGDIRAAHAQMLPKRGDGLEMDWSQLRLGYRMGMCAVLALWVCWDSVWGLVADGNTTIGGRSAFPVFRACGGILLLQWFWGCSVFIWTRHRINYIYLFDFNPKIVATPLGIFEEAVDNSLVFMVLMLLYYKSGAHDIPNILPDGGYPFILVLYTVFQLVFPLRSRMPMWHAIWKVVTAPLHSPSFFHGYIGDIFTSMVKVFQDIAWTVCWVASGDFTRSENMKKHTTFHWSAAHWYKNILIPILCLMPLLIRFNQCLRRYTDTGDRFPHLANAAKYALSQTVTLFGAFHPLYLEYNSELRGQVNLFQIFWMVVFISSSLYSFCWDVFMDWGLGRREYGFLGPSLMYPRRWYYFAVMAIDLVLRFMWVLTLVPPSSGAKFEVPSYLTAVTMMLELFRRTAWGFFRLENEHRSNAAGFRRVGFVPLHFNTGHHHGYKDKKEKSGVSVLREVVLIALVVGGVCCWSVVSAQRANKVIADMQQMHMEL